MSIAEALKEAVGTVTEAVKENPVLAVGIVGAAAALGGGVVFWRRRKAKKAASVNVAETIRQAETAAAAGNAALAKAIEDAGQTEQ